MQEEVRILKQGQQKVEDVKVDAGIESAVEKMTTDYPDWKKYEKPMMKVAAQFKGLLSPQNGEPMGQFEFMELCYEQATKGKKAAKQTRELMNRQNKAAKKAASSRSGVPDSGVESKVPKGAPFNAYADKAKKLLAQDGIVKP